MLVKIHSARCSTREGRNGRKGTEGSEAVFRPFDLLLLSVSEGKDGEE
jgi:hypothetical protein